MNAELSRPQIADSSHRGAGGSPVGEAESDCLLTAQELHRVVTQESEMLKRFAKAELLRLISRKEFLVNELGQKLQCLKTADGRIPSLLEPLKDLLVKIDRINRSNHIFIQRSLAHWQAFLSVLIPSGYGPPGEHSRYRARVPRGFTFSREV